MVKEKNRKSSRFFKGVKSFLLLSNRNNNNNNNNNNSSDDINQRDIYAREGVAVTLTTEFNNKSSSNSATTILNSNLSFMPCQPMSSSCFENKAYVHYEPKKAQVALGTNPDAKHTKSLRLTVEQYAWLIQQLQEEQEVFASLKSIFYQKNYQQEESLPLWNISPMLGVLSSSVSHSKSLGKRLIRFVQQKRKTLMMSVPPQLSQYQLQCIFMLPKALLLQAAAYIPMTKPLPPPLAPIQYHLLSNHPYQPMTTNYKRKLIRYCNYIQLCAHELLTVISSTTFNETLSEPSPPPSVTNSNNKPIETIKIQCADCSINTHNLQTIFNPTTTTKVQKEMQNVTSASFISTATARNVSSVTKSQQQSVMFPVSFFQYTSITTNNTLINSQKLQHQQLFLQKEEMERQQQQKVFMASAIQPSSRRVAFDSITRRQKPQAISAFQYIPPDRTMASSSISSISQYSGIEEEDGDDNLSNNTNEEEMVEGEEEMVVGEEEELNDDSNNNDDLSPQKYGYVSIDRENEEILVVFPGIPMSHSLFENASFAPVPWQEIETIINNPSSDKKNSAEEDTAPWVLECALTAWNRCEMKVVTLLMRLCSVMPSHYKVVIVGYSLGGAVASLCASSLRSTKLLLNRAITVCAIHSPRVGNKAFLTSLSNQNVETIRVTHYKDLMAHLPPRTSGLLHIGDTTIILPIDHGHKEGYLVENTSSSAIEDTLNKTFSFKEYDLNSHSTVWDINLDDKVNLCNINN